jgi:O-Antigen ligase
VRMIEQEVPSFPIYITLPICGATLLLVLFQVWRLRDPCAAFLMLATWFRYSIATFHQYAYPPIAFGLSLIALTSIAVVAIGLVVVGGRNLLLRRLAPFYGIILVILISAFANDAWMGAANATLKWLYLIVFAVAANRAMRRLGSERVLRSFAIVFVAPIALQWLSVPWGLTTTNEDRSTSYLGGYHSQQSLSIILLTFLYVTCFSRWLSVTASATRLAISLAGLVLANYRTALLAAALPAASLAVSKLMGKFVAKQRGVVFVFLGVVTLFVFVGVATVAQERFADIATTFDKGAALIQPPEYFTADERRLFSGRAYLWSEYIDAYLEGNIINLLVGFGPEAWVGRFRTYAHNTFVSYLYELGLFGLAALVWLLLSNFLTAVRMAGEERMILASCHIGFFVLNLSTMPIWTLEGAILYALLLSQTWHLHSIRVAGTEAPYPRIRLRVNAYGIVSVQRR